MGLLIRQTKVPVVKRFGDGEMEHYSKSRRREFTALTYLCWGESLRIHLKARKGHLLYSRGPPGSYIGGPLVYCTIPTLNDAIMVSSCTIIVHLNASIHSMSPWHHAALL